ncbi:MAG: transposase [candidate division KSB1 bacterium]|nr:transposase [candidate division KSB1 bacterium]
MTNLIEKFQYPLHKLFRFDCADLDFGIYRIMNYKRQVIEKWITEDLPRTVSDELRRDAPAEQAAEGWFQLMRLIKRVGGHIINFLAQIEDFQKMLWEKKKSEKSGRNVRDPGNADVPSAVSSAEHKGRHSRGYLPHFDAGNIFQFITFRLHDSVPASVIEQWKQELHWREGLAADSKETVELRKRIEQYADSGRGACYLRNERIARLVQDALKYFDGERYRLIAWCIMPNHVHVLIEVMDVSLSKILQSWKSYTAHEANKLLGRSGAFWGPDYFDRYIRDEKHFQATVKYILQNPVKARLVDRPEQWPWAGYVGLSGNTGNAEISRSHLHHLHRLHKKAET